MGKQQEKARAMSPAPTATIKVKYHDGASKLGSDIHGVMCDLAASETVVLKKGEKSAEVRTAEVRTHRDANGLELHVGDYVIDEFGECYCVMGLHEGYGATAAYADLGNSRTPLEVAPCLSLRLDERPHDCDGVPIEVGDAVWVVYEDGSSVYDCSVVVVNTDGANGLVRVREKSENGWSDFLFPSKLTHREPDSFEKIAADAVMSWEDYCENHRLDVNDDIETEEHAMQADILRRIEAVAARG